MSWSQIVDFSINNVWIIPLLPLLAFSIIIFDRAYEKLTAREFISKKEYIAYMVVGATALGLIQSLIIFLTSIDGKEEFIKVVNYSWLQAGTLDLSFGWIIDNLSIMMLLVVTSVSMLIQIYTHGYMEPDPGYRRFYAYLALFNFSMLGLVLSTNLFQIYIFWELVGLCSYLLIGFWMDRPSAAHAAKKAFIVNRIGDSLFLIGIVGFLLLSYNFWLNNDYAFLSFMHLEQAVHSIHVDPMILTMVGICLFFGAVAKSAQFPLHTWLPDAMEGPTPISALIHAATMVAAGVFLVARVYPIFVASPITMNFIAWTGAITLFMAATIALTQFDIKRVLAYSTCSQLGYMIFAMGIGAYSAGLFHLFTHAYFKAMLFLCSGAVIVGLHHEQDMRFMGGLRKYMPKTAITYLVGTLAISGILFSGFFSKDLILGRALSNTGPAGTLDLNALALFSLAFLGAGLTAFYMFRSYFMTFEGEYRGHSKPHEAPKVMTTPLIILAFPSALIGFILSGFFHMPDFTQYIYFGHQGHHEPNWGMMAASLLIALAGTMGAASFFWDKYKTIETTTVINKIKPLYLLSYNKWYFDELYYWLVRKTFMAASKLSAMFDKYIIDEIVNLVAQITKELGATFKYIQNGKTQFAVLVMYTGLIVISIVLVVYAMI
ncbi:MAG: NADH-quinone oxidoreductase subunit L [Cyanobacteriota bacterium]